jgi:hypothetical protein
MSQIFNENEEVGTQRQRSVMEGGQMKSHKQIPEKSKTVQF